MATDVLDLMPAESIEQRLQSIRMLRIEENNDLMPAVQQAAESE